MRARAAVAIGVLGAAAVVVIGLAAAGSSAPGGPVMVTVDRAHPGRAVPRSFLGFSIEYQSVPAYMGSPGAPNRAFAGLARALGAAQGAPVGLRIGGNSSDQSWWNPAGRPRPPGVLVDLGPAWARSLATGQRALGAPVALGMNLALDDPSNALALVRAVRAAGAAPGVLEIGNEPDLYARGRTFRVGPLVVVRPRQRLRYGPAQYVREASRYAEALRRGLGGTPVLAAGGFATDAWARAAVGGLLAAAPGVIGQLVAHVYALTVCNAATGDGGLRARLLTDDASRGIARALSPYVGRGLPVRVAELNSAVCGGVAGVSDTFAAALWAPDALFALARAGALQADVHTWSGSFYAPFAFGRAVGGPVTATVRPLYYGLLLFARAAPAGSRLLPVRLDGAGDEVRAWATAGAGAAARVLLINRSAGEARELRVRVGRGGAGSASLQRLRAPGLAAGGRVTLAGQRFRTPTASGALPGRPAPGTVPIRAGEVRLTLPPASAALLVER